jgi:hypothetical protein
VSEDPVKRIEVLEAKIADLEQRLRALEAWAQSTG